MQDLESSEIECLNQVFCFPKNDFQKSMYEEKLIQ